MPHLSCLCGTGLSITRLPSIYGFHLIGEAEFDALVEVVASSMNPDDAGRALRERGLLSSARHGHECPTCGRLAVFAHAHEDVPHWYRPERR